MTDFFRNLHWRRLLPVIFLFFTIPVSAEDFPRSLREMQIDAAMVRVSCFCRIHYRYHINSDLAPERTYLDGRTGAGVILDSGGHILVHSSLTEPLLRFTREPDTYRREMIPRIREQIPDIPGSPQPRIEIIQITPHPLAVLANGTLHRFQILSPEKTNELVSPLGMIQINDTDLPALSFHSEENTAAGVSHLYTIPLPLATDPLTPYFNRPGYRFSVSSIPFSPETLRRNLTEMEHPVSGIWVDSQGVLQGLAHTHDGLTALIPHSDLSAFLSLFETDFSFSGSFQKAIDELDRALQNNSPHRAEFLFRKLEGLFYGYKPLRDLHLASSPQTLPADISPGIPGLIRQYHLIILAFLVLLIIILLFLLMRRSSGKPRGTPRMPELPEDPSGDNTPLSEIIHHPTREYIDVFIGGEYHNSYQLENRELVIGRDPSRADVIISEIIVSKVHCRIFKKGPSVFIQDENSTNGLFHPDGNRITEKKLKNGDRITLGRKGRVEILFHDKPPSTGD